VGAQYSLGWCYKENGDYDLARTWLRRAADAGHVEARGSLQRLERKLRAGTILTPPTPKLEELTMVDLSQRYQKHFSVSERTIRVARISDFNRHFLSYFREFAKHYVKCGKFRVCFHECEFQDVAAMDLLCHLVIPKFDQAAVPVPKSAASDFQVTMGAQFVPDLSSMSDNTPVSGIKEIDVHLSRFSVACMVTLLNAVSSNRTIVSMQLPDHLWDDAAATVAHSGRDLGADLYFKGIRVNSSTLDLTHNNKSSQLSHESPWNVDATVALSSMLFRNPTLVTCHCPPLSQLHRSSIYLFLDALRVNVGLSNIRDSLGNASTTGGDDTVRLLPQRIRRSFRQMVAWNSDNAVVEPLFSSVSTVPEDQPQEAERDQSFVAFAANYQASSPSQPGNVRHFLCSVFTAFSTSHHFSIVYVYSFPLKHRPHHEVPWCNLINKYNPCG
jgi:hypothetical protein